MFYAELPENYYVNDSLDGERLSEEKCAYFKTNPWETDVDHPTLWT